MIARRLPLKRIVSVRRFSYNLGKKNYSNSHSFFASSAGNYEAVNQSFSNYNVSVAFQPKDREENSLKRKSLASSSPSGEDNLFVSNEINGYITLGVADGVGGWSEAGYDSSAISRELCSELKTIFETGDNLSISPKELLHLAFNSILKSPKVEIGGTTACLGILTPEKTAKIANLGDSWVGHFRESKLINQTNFQTHKFNTPYQLAKIPQQILRKAELEGRRYIRDTPAKADEYEWNLKQDDILIFATDGVTDNIITQDMEIYLQDNLYGENPKTLQQVSSQFVKEVVKVSKDPNFSSSFAQELSKLSGQQYLGGKEDDVTVVFVKVK